jgi:DNA invertase Pin-like site-specific DNA recombinase
MAEGPFVAYYRVSTDRQGRSGLGLEAQRDAVERFLNGGNWRLADSFTEVESGRKAARPELAKALAACRVHKAKLIIAKLDRLSRNVHFMSSLMESKAEFLACDNPHATRLTIHILAAVAEHEAEMISTRTKAALGAAKARGKQLGGFRGYRPSEADRASSLAVRRERAAQRAQDLAPILADIRAGGITSQRAIAAELTRRKIPTPRGLQGWAAVQVQRLIASLSDTASGAVAAGCEARSIA